MVVSIVMGVPLYRWMVYVMDENWGYPHDLGSPPMTEHSPMAPRNEDVWCFPPMGTNTRICKESIRVYTPSKGLLWLEPHELFLGPDDTHVWQFGETCMLSALFNTCFRGSWNNCVNRRIGAVLTNNLFLFSSWNRNMFVLTHRPVCRRMPGVSDWKTVKCIPPPTGIQYITCIYLKSNWDHRKLIWILHYPYQHKYGDFLK